uniref:Serine/threonine-protein kinase Nek10-like n=1 Tax=Castor canadensis TaxID=51338 RepID=A0A8B7UA64_CASCN
MTKSESTIKAGVHRARSQWHESTEAVELENFSVNYKNERNFSKHPQHQLFQEIFTALVKNRLICSGEANRFPTSWERRILVSVVQSVHWFRIYLYRDIGTINWIQQKVAFDATARWQVAQDLASEPSTLLCINSP